MYKARVARGIEALNKHFGGPGWVHAVDLRKVELSDCHFCTLGQLYGFYPTGKRALDLSTEKAINLGFTLGLDAHRHPKSWVALTQEWKRQIRLLKRRA